jgi:hypothetical protein
MQNCYISFLQLLSNIEKNEKIIMLNRKVFVAFSVYLFHVVLYPKAILSCYVLMD